MEAVLPSAYVFPASGVGGPMEPRNSLLLAAGEHPRVVADLLGHSTTKLTTDTYSHVLPTLARSPADRLDALLAGEELPS